MRGRILPARRSRIPARPPGLLRRANRATSFLIPDRSLRIGRPEVSSRTLADRAARSYDIHHSGMKFIGRDDRRGAGGGLFRVVVLQEVPELADRLRVDLTHARLGHAEHIADLRERQALEV